MTDTAKEMKGLIGAYGEQQGCGWGFVQDGSDGMLTPLKNGDKLKIFADAAEEVVRWEGVVDLDANTRFATVGFFDKYGRPEPRLVDFQVGFQRGMTQEWADMFCGPPLRARLVRAEELQP